MLPYLMVRKMAHSCHSVSTSRDRKMTRWYRMVLILLLAYGIVAEVEVGDESESFVEDATTAALDDTLVTTATEGGFNVEASWHGDEQEEVTSDNREEFTVQQSEENGNNAGEYLTTVSEAVDDVLLTTVQQNEDEELPATTSTTVPSTTSTTTPPERTYGRMVRFGGHRRSSRPTTAEPSSRRSTVNSRVLLNRRGLFNPELRNRYLARFRSTTPDQNS